MFKVIRMAFALVGILLALVTCSLFTGRTKDVILSALRRDFDEQFFNHLLFLLRFGILAIVPSVILIGLSNFFDGLDRKKQQKGKNQLAELIFTDISSGQDRRFFLYLFRPFISHEKIRKTSHFRKSFVRSPVFFPFSLLFLRPRSFEEQLNLALSRSGPLVGLGDDPTAQGIGFIKSDDQAWQHDIWLLANAAIMVLCVPSNREGTKWEIDLLLQNSDLLSKTIFIMMPSTVSRWYHFLFGERKAGRAGDLFTSEISWNYLRDAIGKDMIPPFRAGSGLLIPTHNGSYHLFPGLNAIKSKRMEDEIFIASKFLGVDIFGASVKETMA